ncbi:MAG TPA: ABC transporter substrate-binding protein [Acetobacteraceae bacterium]|nr:ABC transporter substrate-binding protein [Acetobacteraceae bacterium]
MTLTRRESLSALMAAATLVAAPGRGRAQTQDIVVGVPNSLTGGFGEVGQRYSWGVLIALDQINREGGIRALGGAKIKPIVADTTTENPAQAASVARRMLDEDRAIALCGAAASAMTLAVQVEAEKSRVPLITSSYADQLVKRGMKYTFKLTAPGSAIWNFAMDSLVDMMKAEGQAPKSCGIFMGSDAVSMAVSKALPEEAKRIGLPVVAHVDFQGNLTDPSVVVTPILQNRPETIFLSSFLNDAVLIIRTLRGLGIKTPIAAAGGISTDSAGKTLGPAADRIFMPWSWCWDMKAPGNSELNALYKAAHPDAPYPCNNEQLGIGYASGLVLRQALEKAASTDGTKLRDTLSATNFTGLTLPSTEAKFDETGLNTKATMILTEWSGGAAHTVWPQAQQAMKPVL